MNKTLKHNLKTKLKGLKGGWVEQLSEVLWAYRKTTRTLTGESPFALAYGYDAMILVEVRAGSLRRDTFERDQNHELQRIDLDLLEEKRDLARLRNAVYQRRIARYFNSKVKGRSFRTGELVLRKVFANTRKSSDGVLGPNWEGPYRIVEVYRPGTYKLARLDGSSIPRTWNAEHLRPYYQ